MIYAVETENRTDLSTVMIVMDTIRDSSYYYIGAIAKIINDGGNDTLSMNVLVVVFQIKYRMKRRSFDITQLAVLHQDADDDVNTSAIMRLAQNNHQDVHEDDNTIAIMHIVFLYQDVHNENAIVRWLHSVTSTDGEIMLFRLMYLYRNNDTILALNNDSYRMKLTRTTKESSSARIDYASNNTTTEDSSSPDNANEDLIDSNKILNGEYYFALSMDALTNTTEDLIDSSKKYADKNEDNLIVFLTV